MILGQDLFHSIRPLKYIQFDRKKTPSAVRLPLSWALSGPLSSNFKSILDMFHGYYSKRNRRKISWPIP